MHLCLISIHTSTCSCTKAPMLVHFYFIPFLKGLISQVIVNLTVYWVGNTELKNTFRL